MPLKRERAYEKRNSFGIKISMCNRVRASFEFRETKIRWNLFNDLPNFKPSHNVSPDFEARRLPQSRILTVVKSEPGNEGRLMYWPLIPPYARERKLPYSTANARGDRLQVSSTYRRLLNTRRCLIPTDGFYEWQGKRPPKRPFFVYLKSNEPFALAGLWDTWETPDGSILESFAVITVEPNDLMRSIHDRMPVILHKEDEAAWIDCSANPFDKVESLITQFPSELMGAHQVSTRINNPQL